jgi:hypothetical protein
MRNTKLYVLFVILFGIAAVAYLSGITPQGAWNSLFSQGYTYSESQQGVLFASNEAKLSELLPFLASKQSFILSPRMVLGNSPLNTAAANMLIQDQIVLGGHQKTTLTVIRVFENGTPSAKWVSCQTDYGSAKDNETITVEECSELLNTQNSIILELDFPNASQSRPIVELSSSRVIIKPVNENEVSGVNFLFLRAMFSDAEKLIGEANSVVNPNK